MVARASASIARGATTVALAMRSAGSPVRGSTNMRVPPSVNVEPALRAAAGGYGSVPDLDGRDRLRRFRIRPGRGEAERPRCLATDAKVAANVQQQTVYAAAGVQGRSAGAIDDITLGDRIEAERAVGQPPDRVRPRSDPPGRTIQERPRHGQFGIVGRMARLSARDQSRVRISTRGSNAPPLSLVHDVASRENLEELGREFNVPRGAACQRLNSLWGS